jgi:hypothetical protein
METNTDPNCRNPEEGMELAESGWHPITSFNSSEWPQIMQRIKEVVRCNVDSPATAGQLVLNVLLDWEWLSDMRVAAILLDEELMETMKEYVRQAIWQYLPGPHPGPQARATVTRLSDAKGNIVLII